MKNLTITLLLSLLCFFGSAGCGSDSVGDSLDAPSIGSDSGVAHQSWGSYRLYRYENGQWFALIDLGQELEAPPVLGEKPVLILHGLGSNIHGEKFKALADNLVANGATQVVGFEYDTLDPISTNSTYLNLALQFLTRNEKGVTWRVVGHSLGALVARSSFEASNGSLDFAANGNLVSFAAGPHLGSEVAQKLLESDPDLVEQALKEVVLNGQLDFRNADGMAVDVTGEEPVFAQLVPNSVFLQNLNFEAANHHSQFSYRTVAGTERGDSFEAFNRVLGVFADDGMVNVESANAQVIGQVQADTVPFNHSEVVETQASILVILDHLDLIK